MVDTILTESRRDLVLRASNWFAKRWSNWRHRPLKVTINTCPSRTPDIQFRFIRDWSSAYALRSPLSRLFTAAKVVPLELFLPRQPTTTTTSPFFRRRCRSLSCSYWKLPPDDAKRPLFRLGKTGSKRPTPTFRYTKAPRTQFILNCRRAVSHQVLKVTAIESNCNSEFLKIHQNWRHLVNL